MIKSVEIGETISCIEQSKDGKILILGTINGHLLFYDLRKLTEQLHKIKAHKTGAVNCINVSTNTLNKSNLQNKLLTVNINN